MSAGRRSLFSALALVAGLAVAAWGLARTLPGLATAAPGYLARDLLPVILWALLAAGCVAGLIRMARRR